MDDYVGFEHIPNPTIISVVVMGHRQIRAVIDGGGAFDVAAGGLKSNKHVAVKYPRNQQVTVVTKQRARRGTPIFNHPVLSVLGQFLKPFSVLSAGDLCSSPFREFLRIQPPAVIG
jgi:hypothetical protein